jgi:2-amino-4-hydroxy-6-hydroxymethyldihydropteridine diphosphokinase
MILIALGSNISGPWGSPEETLKRAVKELNRWPLKLATVSTVIKTKPFGNTNQPNFVNAVAIISTALSPDALIRKLHMIEHKGGRRRRKRWGPRTLDLDIIDYNGQIRSAKLGAPKDLVLPHTAIAERTFVLEPIAEIAPRWKHPVNHKSAALILRKLYRLNRI